MYLYIYIYIYIYIYGHAIIGFRQTATATTANNISLAEYNGQREGQTTSDASPQTVQHYTLYATNITGGAAQT